MLDEQCLACAIEVEQQFAVIGAAALIVILRALGIFKKT